MQDNRAEQIEALNTAKDYCTRLYKGVNALADELRTGRLPDTEEYMKTVINGINWVFEVYNATKKLINENCDYIDKNKVNAGAVELGKAVADNDDEALTILEEFVNHFDLFSITKNQIIDIIRNI